MPWFKKRNPDFETVKNNAMKGSIDSFLQRHLVIPNSSPDVSELIYTGAEMPKTKRKSLFGEKELDSLYHSICRIAEKHDETFEYVADSIASRLPTVKAFHRKYVEKSVRYPEAQHVKIERLAKALLATPEEVLSLINDAQKEKDSNNE